MRAKLVVGNWKLNGSLAANRALLEAVVAGLPKGGKTRFGVCVPAPYLAQAQQLLAGSALEWGAQDVSRFAKGAYTGEVSAAMVAEFGSRLALAGHSERRTVFGDTDAMVAEKFAMALAAGLTPILCVGESLAEREAGVTESVVARQLDAVLDTSGVASLGRAVVAYEPVWAIGTGRTASAQQAQEVHAFIRARVAAKDGETGKALPILYGGSVKAGNAGELFAMPDVDGGLIGGASLVAGEFIAICRAA
jgi:triosephosphate isomerase (TIM)